MQDFEDYLMEKYPNLFPKDADGKPRHSDCGVSCPVGWQDLIDKLCGSIDWHVKNGGKNEITNKISLGVHRFIWNNLKISKLLNSIEHSIDPVDWQLQKSWLSSDVDKIRKDCPKRTAFLKSFQRFKWSIMPKAKFKKIPVAPVTIGQIKSKYGTLRFYYDGGDGTIRGMVIFAELLSESVCEETGGKGIPCSKGGWWATLCEEKMEEFGYKPTNQ
jgi:hypothetical protein